MATSATATLYRKTAAGQAELTQRQAGLTPRARTVLVMVNGVETVARLVETLGAEVPTVLQMLVDKGLIEPVTMARAVPEATPAKVTTSAAPAKAPAATAPVAAPPAPPPAPGPTPTVLHALLELLVPHFGPDATRVAEGALRATNAHDYHAALDAVGARLAIHLGRKKAEQMLLPLRLG